MPKTAEKKYKTGMVKKYHPKEISRDLRTAINLQLGGKQARDAKRQTAATVSIVNGTESSSLQEISQIGLNSTPIKGQKLGDFCIDISPVSEKDDCNKTYTVLNIIEDSSDGENENHQNLLAYVPPANVDLTEFRKL